MHNDEATRLPTVTFASLHGAARINAPIAGLTSVNFPWHRKNTRGVDTRCRRSRAERRRNVMTFLFRGVEIESTDADVGPFESVAGSELYVDDSCVRW
jgi:hypothetical protein